MKQLFLFILIIFINSCYSDNLNDEKIIKAPQLIKFIVEYDAEDNIYRIDGGHWQVNKNIDTWECTSNEICFSVDEDCSLVCKSDKYKFISLVLDSDEEWNDPLPWNYNIWNSQNTSYFSIRSDIYYMCEIANEYYLTFIIYAHLIYD